MKSEKNHWLRTGLQVCASVALAVSVSCGDSTTATESLQYVGQTDDGFASLAFAKTSEQLTAYVCNDTDASEWFDATPGSSTRELTSKTGARLVLTSANDFSQGVFVSANGIEHHFRAAKAAGDEGLFRLSGQELVGRPPAGQPGIPIEAIINNAMIQSIKAQFNTAETSKFSAGWILGPNGSIVGNVTVQRTGPQTVGNKLPLSRQVIASSALSVFHPVKTASPIPTSDNSCNAEFSAGACERAVARNSVLVTISNGLNSVDWDSAYVNDLLSECAEFLTTYCA